MFFIVNDPGPWQYFINRSDNVGLPLMEVKSKYLHEQLLFENHISFVQHQQALMAQSAGGGGPLPGDDTTNKYVEDGYVEDGYVE